LRHPTFEVTALPDYCHSDNSDNNTASYDQNKTTTRSTFPRKIGGTRSAPTTKNGRMGDTNLFG
jgi:hypothetical protein